MGRAIEDRRDSVFLMTKVCTHGRNATVAMRQLHESLRRLRTDYLDLWQVHECVYDNDPERHFARGGVVEALDRAKRQGKGDSRISGHNYLKSSEKLSFDYRFDACQLPLTASMRTSAASERYCRVRAPAACRDRQKIWGYDSSSEDRAPADALRYAMSPPGARRVVDRSMKSETESTDCARVLTLSNASECYERR